MLTTNDIISTMQNDADTEAAETTVHGQAYYVQLDEVAPDMVAIEVEGLRGLSSGNRNEGPYETL